MAVAAETAGEVVRHWTADINGVSLHVAESGPTTAGAAVLLVHGFPEMWLSWRHQMAALAARGFRALAPDLRGYGDSSVPADPAAYSILHIVGDLVALLDHLRLPRVFLVGHDWGAQVAWHLCLFRPDRVRAAVILGIPYFPRGPQPMTDLFAKLGDGFYINQFQVEFTFAAQFR
jgi:pimeloyl-ACP methyl ester carboxylesterase